MPAAAQSALEEAGLMPVTDRAVENRSAHKVDGDLLAHYQLLNSRDSGRDVYWVERYDRKGTFASGYLVELVNDDGLLWASCQCDWFLKFRKGSTVCCHILSAVQMQRMRG